MTDHIHIVKGDLTPGLFFNWVVFFMSRFRAGSRDLVHVQR